jgi:Transposase DDE domain
MQKEDFLALLKTMKIGDRQIQDIAVNTGFLVRKKFVAPADILYAICCQSIQGTVSFNDLATKIDAEIAVSVSRQAIGKKMNKPSCMDFLKKILALVILSKINKNEIHSLRQQGKFSRVLVQDSTIIGLPARLFAFFSGVSNGHVSVCNARIQCVYDLIAENFISFTIDPYTKNDLKAAPELELRQGDVVIRDRGYLTSGEMERHREVKADCIYRHKSTMIYLNIQTGKEIDLLAELKAKKKIDCLVLLNDKNATPVRLLAFPVNEEIANLRRMKAKKEMKKTPSKEYLELLSWSIFITTISPQVANSDFILKAYRLRWRIEIIFKSWKSNMEFAKIHNVSKTQLSTILFARFIMIIICIQYIFSPAKTIIKEHLGKDLSMIKVVRCLTRNPSKIISIVTELTNYCGKCTYHLSALARYCAYENRTRPNFEQEFTSTFA